MDFFRHQVYDHSSSTAKHDQQSVLSHCITILKAKIFARSQTILNFLTETNQRGI